MNKVDLADVLARKLRLSRPEAARVLSATLDSICEAVAAGEKVQLVGFGVWELRQRRKRGQPFGGDVGPTTALQFRPGKKLLEAVEQQATKSGSSD